MFSSICANIMFSNTLSSFFNLRFVLEYSRVTILGWFQENTEGTQPCVFLYPFSRKLPSHPGCPWHWGEFPVLHTWSCWLSILNRVVSALSLFLRLFSLMLDISAFYHTFLRGRLEFIDFRSYEIAKTKVIFKQGNVPLAKNTDILNSLLYSLCCIHFHKKKSLSVKKELWNVFLWICCLYVS